MAGHKKPLRSDQPSIKYQWNPVGKGSSELSDFVPVENVPSVSGSYDKHCGKRTESNTPGVLSTAELMSAVGRIWDCANRPLAFFQPKTKFKHNDCRSEKEVVLGLGGEGKGVASSSARSNYFSVNITTAGQILSPVQTNLQFLNVTQKISVFEPLVDTMHLSFWKVLQNDEPMTKEHWREHRLASVQISSELENTYSWMNHIIDVGSKYPIKVTHFKSRTSKEGSISLAEACVSTNTITSTSDLTNENADCDHDLIKSYNSSPLHHAKVEMNTSSSLYSDYFLTAVQDNKTEGRILRSQHDLYGDYNVNTLSSCNGAFKEFWDIIDESEVQECQRKQLEKSVGDVVCEEDICSAAHEKPHSTLAKQEHAFAGALAGMFVSLCLHPFDTIKTVVQSCRAEQKSVCYIGKSIISDRGLTGLYRGIATNIASSAPISALYTFTYESVKGAILPLFPKEYCSLAHCAAGGSASIATSLIFTPSEHIKQQMQVGSHYPNCWNALVGIVRKGGFASLYAGWGAVVCRNVPHSIIKFYTYESLKPLISSSLQSRAQPTPLHTLVCGGISGSIAALFTTPFDVVKTRLQTQIPGSMSQYSTVIDALWAIGKNEGLKGLYRGLTPRLVMYMSQGAIFFSSYEFFKRLFSLESSIDN